MENRFATLKNEKATNQQSHESKLRNKWNPRHLSHRWCFWTHICLSSWLYLNEWLFDGCPQRTSIAAVWAFKTSHAGTAADACTIADVLFFSHIYNVKPVLKPNFYCCWCLQRPAQIAAIPLLAAVFLSSISTAITFFNQIFLIEINKVSHK